MLSETVKSWPAQWMAKGRKEDREEAKREIVLNMYIDGLPIDKICHYTGLPRQKMEEWAKEFKNNVSENPEPYCAPK